MKINLVSDIHLEFADLELPGGEVLILAGDACEARSLKPSQYRPNDTTLRGNLKRPDRVARFFAEELVKYDQVIYVLGNHEHYHSTFHKTREHLAKNLPANVKILDNDVLEYGGILFVGGTLWTDANREDPITMMALKDNMSDYHAITKWHGGNAYSKLHPRDTVREHYETRGFIVDTVKANADKQIVVVTHHAPSSMSIAEVYRDEYLMNGGYVSNLESVILDNPNIQYWCHGHTHVPFDYTIAQCRIMCNPRGYVGYENVPFDVNFMLEIINT